MSFWTVQGGLQPKLKDRFLVIIGNKVSFVAKSVTKPSLTFDNKEYKMINHHFKYPGLGKWNSIKISFVDLAGQINTDPTTGADQLATNPDTANELWRMITSAGYSNPTGTSYASKESMIKALGDIQIQQISPDVEPDPSGTTDDAPKAKVVEEWKLINPIIKSISWGDLSYDDDGMVLYELELDYDYAEISRGHNALGSAE